MVDLVKIRRKAKKQKEEQAAEAGMAETPSQSTPAPSTADREFAAEMPATVAPPALPANDPKDVREGIEAAQPVQIGSLSASAPQSSKLDRFKAEAGHRRERESAGPVEQTDREQIELLTFEIASELYAVDIERIVEIVTPRPLTRIPNADVSVVGIVSLRGTIVTLVDVRRKLGHPAAEGEDDETRIVVIDLRNEMIGFVVDRVLRVVKTTPEAIEPHPVVHTAELDEAVRGVFRSGDALTILLDLDKLLDHSKLAAVTA